MKLRIGPYPVTVGAMSPGYSSDHGVHGHFLPNQLLIELDPSMAPARQAEILLHEVLHGVWMTTALADKVSEETAVTALARGLLQVIVDNPELVPLIRQAATDNIAIVT